MLSSNFGKKLQLRIYNIGAAAEGYNVILIKNDCTQKNSSYQTCSEVITEKNNK